MRLQTYVQDIIEERRKAPLIRGVLLALSKLYKTGVALRNYAYDRLWLKTFESSIPVISVGNIVAGGTGKTPLIRLLLEELTPACTIALLSRGYRSQIEKSKNVINLAKTPTSPEICGDEPYWISTLFPKTPIWVGKNRVLSAQKALEEGAECLLLDDGMQYRSLHRDIDVVVMDAHDLFGKNHYLPRGYLRDSRKRLSQADLIVVNHAEGNLDAVCQKIALYSKAPIVATEMRLEGEFRNKKIGVFCGIGKPHHFVKALKREAAVVGELISRDHCLPSQEELAEFAERCQAWGAEMLVCTEKDLVKLDKNLKIKLPICVAKGILEIVSGEEHWENLIHKIKGMLHGRS